MRNLISKLVADESAQDLAEYGIALAVISLGAGVAALAISGNVSTLWQNAQSVITQAAG
jgi:Flp pilus assembly pilin Flp